MPSNLTPFQHYGNFWKNYFDFSGRTSRPGFWWVILINIMISAIISIAFSSWTTVYIFSPELTMHAGYLLPATHNPIADLFSLAAFIPGIAILHRRYHDAGKRAREFWHGILIGFILIVLSFAASVIGLFIAGLYWIAFIVKTIVDLCKPSVADKKKAPAKKTVKKKTVKKSK